MPSDKQLDANRRNAQKSTGPRTAAGKAISSANALKTGIHSASHIIKGESPADLEALTAEYYAEHHPTSASQRLLVDTLIHNDWLLRRLRRAESDLWNKGIEFIEESSFQPKNHLEADTFYNKIDTLTRLHRRIDALDRAWHRALKTLLQLQAEPREPDPPEDPVASIHPIDPQPIPSPIGFVPSPSSPLPPDIPSIPIAGLRSRKTDLHSGPNVTPA